MDLVLTLSRLAPAFNKAAGDKIRGTAVVSGVPHSVVAVVECGRVLPRRGALLLLHLYVRQLPHLCKPCRPVHLFPHAVK